ncbi:MAG: cytochrome c4 [Pseudomonadota bacterium]
MASTAGAAPPVSVPDTMAQRLVACTVCHGKQGRATEQGYFPRIAGKPAGYLYRQLLNFRDGRRRNATMTYLVEHLDDAYLRQIAEHFASLDLPYPAPAPSAASAGMLQHGQALAQRGDAARRLPACTQCHGLQLTGVQPAIPGLLGLPRDYLVAQFGNWRTGVRQAVAPDCMAEIAQRLSPEDIAAVSSWLAAQPVPQPAAPEPPATQALPLRCGSVAP